MASPKDGVSVHLRGSRKENSKWLWGLYVKGYIGRLPFQGFYMRLIKGSRHQMGLRVQGLKPFNIFDSFESIGNPT